MKTLQTLALALGLSFAVSSAALAQQSTPPAVPSVAPATETTATATLIKARVNGMVCDFCAQAVEKVFLREDAVDTVTIDLDDGTIAIILKPGQALGDERIAELVKKSGYALVSIDRTAA